MNTWNHKIVKASILPVEFYVIYIFCKIQDCSTAGADNRLQNNVRLFIKAYNLN